MRGKILFVIGAAAGYVIGARAGRSAYDAIVTRVRGAASDPRVKEAAGKAKSALEERAPEAVARAEQVADTAAGVASAAKEAGEAAGDDSPTGA